jgi:hypothetical protein
MAGYCAISVEPITTSGDTVSFTATIFEPFVKYRRSTANSEYHTTFQAPFQIPDKLWI